MLETLISGNRAGGHRDLLHRPVRTERAEGEIPTPEAEKPSSRGAGNARELASSPVLACVRGGHAQAVRARFSILLATVGARDTEGQAPGRLERRENAGHLPRQEGPPQDARAD